MNRPDASRREELVELLPRLRRFARALTRHPADADDLVQLAVERALPKLDQLDTGSRIDSWMFRIIRNAWIDERRVRARWNAVLAPEEAGEQVGDASAQVQLALLSVQSAMDTLPAEQRLAVALVLVEGLSYKEAADLLEVPVGTLTSRLARARTTLQALLGEVDGEEA
jgi:RNA polymerase sigma-70 factor (ECF subfamily)